jgi:predicted nucleic acid-binding protein
MSFLLDTNVLSELGKRQPDAAARRGWSSRGSKAWQARSFISVLVLGEIARGSNASAAGIPTGPSA